MANKRNNRRVASVTRLRRQSVPRKGPVDLSLGKKRQIRKRYRRLQAISGCILAVCVVAIVVTVIVRLNADYRHHAQEKEIKQTKEENISQNLEKKFRMPTAGIATVFQEILEDCSQYADTDGNEISMLPEYAALYEQNPDIVGWLRIEDTVIDYPVMQTMEDEDYYLAYDFNKEANNNGCLIMDTDSVVGVGTAEHQYADGTKPSTNLIIHGHTMKSGMMFGGLKKYAEESYGRDHSIICFDSLYEKREYELIVVFYSQVYMNTDEVFKYYQFFQADTEEVFDDWYKNIKSMSLYDTGVSAELGDEFITLSCCSYHTEDGRFVVVGKRIK
jgi:sortase B